MPVAVGVDYAWWRPAHPSDLPEATVEVDGQAYPLTFAVRYACAVDPSKGITGPEVSGLFGAGVNLVVVYEDEADPLNGKNDVGLAGPTGATLGTNCRGILLNAGLVTGGAAYLAFDSNRYTDPATWPAAGRALDMFGASTRLPVGVYGPEALVGQMMAQGHAVYGWIAAGWRDVGAAPDAQLLQTLIPGPADWQVDVDEALAPSFGQWAAAPLVPPITYTAEVDVQLVKTLVNVQIGPNGRGWTVMDGHDVAHPAIPFAQAFGVEANGSDPTGPGGYVPLLPPTMNDRGGFTQIEAWAPGTVPMLGVWVTHVA